ncbi:MAG: LD-carboxypeptidase [Candidatus Aminicenantes bacterium]|nr:LD-carboxypeptidase [Candidatus Aminicenantes bacterium]
MLRKPEPLKPGDQVGVFLPSSPIREPFHGLGLQALQGMGLRPREVSAPLSGHDFFARPPEQGLADLQGFFSDPQIKVLWAGRGGYGSNYLLPLLDRLVIQTPKIVIASSDASYLLWYLLDRRRMTVFYGPMVFGALAAGHCDRDQILTVLAGDAYPLEIPGVVLCRGRARGMISGGCLANFASLLGTPHAVEVRGRILLLEDVNERPFRIDRMLWQCEQAGVFAQIKGLLLGEFPGCFKDENEKEIFYRRWQEKLSAWDIPVLFDMPLGHAESAGILPLGVEGEIDTAALAGLACREKGVRG